MVRAGDTARASRILQGAYEHGTPVPPLSATFPGLTVDQACDIRLDWVASQVQGGRAVRGHKVGLTSAAMQRRLGVDQPDFGHLLAGIIFDENETVPTRGLLQPRIEPELAFVLGEDLAGPGVTVESAAAGVEYVFPALEVIDSRIADWRITIADNASSAAVVLGASGCRLSGVDLEEATVVLTRNGETVGTGLSPARSWATGCTHSHGWPTHSGAAARRCAPATSSCPARALRPCPSGAGDMVTASFGTGGVVTGPIGF
jgi:2-keto-4-pentenoate hydratase